MYFAFSLHIVWCCHFFVLLYNRSNSPGELERWCLDIYSKIRMKIESRTVSLSGIFSKYQAFISPAEENKYPSRVKHHEMYQRGGRDNNSDSSFNSLATAYIHPCTCICCNCFLMAFCNFKYLTQHTTLIAFLTGKLNFLHVYSISNKKRSLKCQN